jgi:transcriptional regulatory protein RtcR
MCTVATGGRITTDVVDEETARLRRAWRGHDTAADAELDALLGADAAAALDLFDRMQLEAVVRVARECRSVSDAGRRLFARSRARKASANDADRLRKYLARFGLTWDQLRRNGAAAPA